MNEESLFSRVLFELVERSMAVMDEVVGALASPEAIERAIRDTETEMRRLSVRLTNLREALPPFKVGQRVQVMRDGRSAGVGLVRAVERTERSRTWVVFVRYPNSDQEYTYPAERLELA